MSRVRVRVRVQFRVRVRVRFQFRARVRVRFQFRAEECWLGVFCHVNSTWNLWGRVKSSNYVVIPGHGVNLQPVMNPFVWMGMDLRQILTHIINIRNLLK